MTKITMLISLTVLVGSLRKFQMHYLQLAKGLWKYVDGSAALAEDADEGFCTEVQKAVSTLLHHSCIL